MNVFTFSRSLVLAMLVIAQSLWAYPSVLGQQQNEPNHTSRDNQQDDQAKLPGDQTPSPEEHADDHSPALGVLVSSCPGEAVCVRDVIWGSPADEEGIEPGDYILSVDGQKVTTPAAFRKLLDQKDAKQKVKLTVWRQSQQINKTVSLAAKSEKLPDAHNAWLGVMLTPTDSEGIEILQVVPGSPADEAGLKSGERILQMNDKEVKNVESFVECVDDFAPGKEVKLAVGGNGSKREVQVKLGELQNAPMRVLREVYSEALEPFDSPPQNVSTESLELIDQTLDQMRQQIRTLEKEVRELRSGKQTQNSDHQEEDAKQKREAKDAKSNNDEKEDRADDQFSYLQNLSSELSVFPAILARSPVSTIVAQQDGRRSNSNQNRGRNWGNSGNWNYRNNSNWGNRYSLPNYSQHYGSQRYGSRYGNYYNSYPNYGNSYYRYGGQPYYYNRGYGSGLGNFGINFGIPRFGTRSGTGFFWF